MLAEAQPGQLGTACGMSTLPEAGELVPLGQGLFPACIAQAFALPSLDGCFAAPQTTASRRGAAATRVPSAPSAPPPPQQQQPQRQAQQQQQQQQQQAADGSHDEGTAAACEQGPAAEQSASPSCWASGPASYGAQGVQVPQPHRSAPKACGSPNTGSVTQHLPPGYGPAYPMYMPYPGGGAPFNAMPGMMSNNPVMQFGGMHPPISDHTLYSSLSYSGGGPSSSGPPQYMRMGGSMTETTDDDGDGARAVKRARLVWTPQLHKRFEEAVSKLGPEKSIPKNIMQEMNVEGLTRENVASHLQKYRLQQKATGKDDDTTTKSNASDPSQAT